MAELDNSSIPMAESSLLAFYGHFPPAKSISQQNHCRRSPHTPSTPPPSRRQSPPSQRGVSFDPCLPGAAGSNPQNDIARRDPTSSYPSPPTSNAHLKHSVPLPCSAHRVEFIGVLDSPPLMRNEDLYTVAPLSPPPTLPTSTHALPEMDYEEQEEQRLMSSTSQLLSPISPTWDAEDCGDSIFHLCEKQHVQHLGDYNYQDPAGSSWTLSPESLSSSMPPSPSPIYMASDDVSSPPASPRPSRRPLLSLLDIPPSPPGSHDAHDSPGYHDDNASSDEENFEYESAYFPPHENRFRSTSPIDMDDELDLTPGSPVLQMRSLDLDDSGSATPGLFDAPSSPSRRSFSSLPDLEFDDPSETFDAPSSPGLSLLALPGADTDDDLVPPPPEDFSAPPSVLLPPPSPSNSLLLIDDPNDVPYPRSPSPEDFDLDFDDVADPELAKMNDLRKRAVAAERAARHAEAQYTEQGVLGLRAEARRVRRREKERRKEVGALLQLKLGGRASSTGDAYAGVRGSLSSLVAKMIFRRNETFRSLPDRKNVPEQRSHPRSPLFKTHNFSDLPPCWDAETAASQRES
ncbi:hypothetical protein PLICRDRAFT_698522 [Plicaturopsis crispa FD-325 SS-3]|nr:hypothetical protein PLICRDRAFT_698522 [Plicaturopsis crispa FD-325 SS-3]